MALTGSPLWELRQPFSQGGSSPLSRSSMIRSAISSSTRCREGLPPLAAAGFRARRLAGAAALLVLVLALGVLVLRLLVVMGCVFSFRVGVRLFLGWAGLGRRDMRGAWRFRGGIGRAFAAVVGFGKKGMPGGGGGGFCPTAALQRDWQDFQVAVVWEVPGSEAGLSGLLPGGGFAQGLGAVWVCFS